MAEQSEMTSRNVVLADPEDGPRETQGRRSASYGGDEDFAPVDPAPAELRGTGESMAPFRHVLVNRHQSSTMSQRQMDALTTENARLRQELVLLVQQVAQTRHFAHHDVLTGLPNRTLLIDRLEQAMAQAVRQQKQVVLLLLDLDGFKAVNDSFGHVAGDGLLKEVSKRLASCIRGGDTACRYGGDEFVILLPDVADQVTAIAVADRIRERIAEPYTVDDVVIGGITASIGAAVYPADGKSHIDLIREADRAMYRAKTNGKPWARTLRHSEKNADESPGESDPT